MPLKIFPILLFGILAANQAHAAGFEKSVMWSGKHAGYAGAAGSVVNGAQSTFFNPAGLAAGKTEVSANFSPTSIKLEGNVISTDRREESDHNFSPIGALGASYKLTDSLGMGLSLAVAAGNKVIYDGVDLTGDAPAQTAFKPRIATDFVVFEYAIGAGYQVAPGWRVGAAWRILDVDGALATIKKSVAGTAYAYVNLGKLEDTKYNGFRLGVQYTCPDDTWGAGLTFRNKVSFVGEGNENSGNVAAVAGPVVAGATSGPVSVGTSLPMQISLAGHYQLSEKFRLLSGVDFAKYSDNQQLSINGNLTSALLGGTVALPNIPLNWDDLWNFRLGGEYTGLSNLALRAGYALTTRVTSKTDSRATISPPGTGHLITVGAGTSFLKDALGIDGAFEYAFNTGTGSMSATPAGATTRELLAGVETESKATSIALHLGATYRF